MTDEADRPNHYYDTNAIATLVAQSRHRDVVGGWWDIIGKLQYDFLRAHGLQPSSRFIDIGCGSLRGGVHFVAFLRPGHYHGIDINQTLLDAGYEIELAVRKIQDRLPRANLVCDDSFAFSRFATRFDLALAHSVFTHLPGPYLQACLARLASSMAPEGALFATFFIVPDHHPIGAPYLHPGGVQTFDDRDPYHYRSWQLRDRCIGLPWSCEVLGDWQHPRHQQMVRFHLHPAANASHVGQDTRVLYVVQARELPPGADHYRAFVGPPDRYDFMSASQFALLFTLGLRETHRVLDIGCGSLRLGRLLIPFLRPEGYFGIDPNSWLMTEAIARELGSDILWVKRPSFASNDDFHCGVFGRTFDYIVAQSILTHCGSDLARMLLGEMRAALAENGRIVFSIMEAPDNDAMPAETGWIYPDCVQYGPSVIPLLCAEAGLMCCRIPWHHPGATWYVAAHRAEYLPDAAQMHLLRGAVLFDPQFQASRSN